MENWKQWPFKGKPLTKLEEAFTTLGWIYYGLKGIQRLISVSF